ncbi:hypothetical protein BC936DRAFT_137113 [Jimgerdemannia flammicorona]|uniref:Beta-galactosidase jelly roll domain-containing protein n=1 Tax=Jimgerdemannia flammicorona TaxID=994334 RepID=A0A433CY03_9FUNG|nr:hypothetical protein BC936DRAFT_137113 [Jimgerdemannia flammicorona]
MVQSLPTATNVRRYLQLLWRALYAHYRRKCAGSGSHYDQHLYVLWRNELGNVGSQYIYIYHEQRDSHPNSPSSDVYTSYDYSACIREYGYLSSRARHLRLTFLFARSFTAHFARTDRARTPSVSVSIPHILNVQRISASATTTPARDPPVEFTFLRNFDRKRRDRFEVTLATRNVTLECALAYKKSFIALGKYTAAYSRVRLELSTVPIHLRLKSPAAQATEVWVVDANSAGQMAFDGTVVVTGSLEAIVKPAAGGSVSVVSFGKKRGWAKIERTGAGYEAENGKLYVLALNEKELSTLGAEFVEPYWDARGDGEGRDGAVTAMWGVYDAWVERGNGVIVVEREEGDRSVTVVSFEKPRDDGFRGGDGEWDGLPFVYTKTFEDLDTTSSPSPTTLLANIELRDWQTRPVDLSAAKWLPLQFPSASSPHPSLNAIDYHFTSGHILYRCTFPSPAYGRKVRLSLNVRNRATVYLNDRFVGGHTTYSLQLFLPGAKVGPDPAFLGSKNYDLTSHLLQSEHNTLLVLVDSFGLSRQAFVMNDVRNSRGIIRAAVKGIGSQNLTWSVTGVDVRHLQNPFNSTGIPDDPTVGTYFSAPAFDRFIPDAGPTWYQCMFDHPLAGGQVHAPLRLVIEGRFTTYVVLNDVVVARYYGDSEGEGDADGPQHDFYLMDGLVRPQGNVIRLLVYGWREISNIRVQIKGWVIERGSGNLAKSVAGVEEGMPFSFVRETVRI